jgi:hypothetical protein
MLFIIYLLKICLILHISKGCNNLIRITWEGVIMCAVLHGGGGVIMCAVLHGGIIWIFQNGGRKFCMKSSI